MTQYLEVMQQFLQIHRWLIRPAALLGTAILLTYLVYIFYQRIQPKLIRNKNFMISALVEAIQWPLVVAIWGEVIISILPVFIPKLDSVLPFIPKLREVGFTLLFAWIFVRFIRIFEEQLLLGHFSKKHLDETTVQAVSKLLHVLAAVMVILFTLPVVGIPISGIVAFGGGSAIVVGIGAQQILANYFGGLIIYSERHFKVGDWIYSPDKEIEGTVEYIGWRATQLRTFDKRPLFVPNAAFSSIIVVNASRMTNRRIKEVISLRHTDAQVLDAITKDVRSMLKEHPDIDQRQIILVHFTHFGNYSLDLNIYTFTRTRDWQGYLDVQQDVFLKIIQIIEQRGAALAFRPR